MELLVVIAIISALATLLLLQLGVARGKARDLRRVTDTNQLRSIAEMYFDDNGGQYPTAMTIANVSKYLSASAVPLDPITGIAYFYGFDPLLRPNKYQVWTELENKNTNALTGDSDINSSAWAGGDRIDASNPVTTEACTANYQAGAARDCLYDVGQK